MTFALIRTESIPIASAAACSFFRYAKLSVNKKTGETCVKIIEGSKIIETLPLCAKGWNITNPFIEECETYCSSHSKS